MMTVSELNRRYHEATGIVFSSMYPGCIAETALFREKRQWFRKLFPAFMKYVTGGYVGEAEAGERLAQVIDDPQCDKSGVYWSWNGGAQTVGRWSEDGSKFDQILFNFCLSYNSCLFCARFSNLYSLQLL